MLLVQCTGSKAQKFRAEVGGLPGPGLTVTLWAGKIHIARIDDGFVCLGIRIQRRGWCDGRCVVPTMPAKPALASVAVGQPGPPGLGRPLRYGATRRTFSCLGCSAWWRLLFWNRNMHLTWRPPRRRYYQPGVPDHTVRGRAVPTGVAAGLCHLQRPAGHPNRLVFTAITRMASKHLLGKSPCPGVRRPAGGWPIRLPTRRCACGPRPARADQS